MRIQRRELDRAVYHVRLDEAGGILSAATSLGGLLSGEKLPTDLLDRLGGPAARVLAPTEPTKIVCIGLNYRRHAEEMGKPLPEYPQIFLKPSTAVIPHGMPIVLPNSSAEVHHEGELAVVIGKTAHRVPEDRAGAHILGYTIMNDVTARDIQRRENKYTHAKGFDTFAPLGPTIVTAIDPDALQLEVRVNGAVRQASPTADMIFKIPAVIAHISRIMTLLPGDVVSTGTPSGVGPLLHGDTVDVAIDGIGILTNPVEAEAI